MLCCWLTEEICVHNTICSGSTVLHTVLCGWLRGEGFTYTNLEGLFFSASFAFPFSLLVCHPLDASHYTDEVALNSFFSQFMFFCSFPVALSSGWSRSTPPPGSFSLYSTPHSIALLPHYSLSLSGTPLFVCIVWVCTNGREFLHQPPIGWRRPTRIGCMLCRVREREWVREGEGGVENSSRLGSGGKRRWSAWVFLFWDGRVWNQEKNESALLSVAYWAYRLRHSLSSCHSLSLFLFCHVQLCFPLLLFCSSCCPSTQMQPTPGSESVSLFQGGGTAGAATTNRKLSKRILTQASWSSFLWWWWVASSRSFWLFFFFSKSSANLCL